MSLSAWYTLAVVLATTTLLMLTWIGADLILVAALTALLVGGVLSPAEALAGFSNPGLASIAVLYIVASGLTETGVARRVLHSMLGRPHSVPLAQARLMGPVVGLSAFLNNTPVVAMLIEPVQEWARKNAIPVSKLMLPLSYAAIFGGMCTVIGTSTNLIVAGLVSTRSTLAPIGFFEIAWVGLPSAIAGALFLIIAGHWLLPERLPPNRERGDPRQYALEMMVEPGSALAGQTIEGAGLRRLPGLFLAEIERAGGVLPAVAPTERLQAGDRLVFVGGVESVVDLYKIRGLIPAPDQVFKLDAPRPERLLVEAVVSMSSPLVGQTIRDGRFRTRYDAVVIAVARDGARIPGRIGDISLRPGDALLLEARPGFADRHRQSRDFILVSALERSSPPRHEQAVTAGLILGAMVIAVAGFRVPMLVAALVAAGLMLLTRCTTGPSARRSVDWQVLIVIAAALALGAALEKTGVASQVAHAWIGLAGNNAWLALGAVYVVTSVLTNFITNNAAAVLVFPIAAAAAAGLGVSFRPFVMAIMMAASASFATPIGYQTNLMVYGPGGYRATDYLRIGLPLNILLGALTTLLAPVIWPF